MNETEIRDRLLDLAADAPTGSTAPPELLRRARRRALVTIASSVAIVIVLIGAGIVGVRALGSRDEQPAVRPSVRPFAIVHGWIAYRSGFEIVAVDPANPRNTLVLGPSFLGPTFNRDPIAWSADGTKLLLRVDLYKPSGFSGNKSLDILDSDGFPTPVTGSSDATWGSFSPDGNEIVYGVSERYPGPYIIEANGSTPRSLVGRCGDRCGEPFHESAAWSPDGTRIAWVDWLYEDYPVLSFVNPDGTGLQTEVVRLPDGVGDSLTWSPDGSRLAFSNWDSFGQRPGQVFVINADGSGLVQITNDGDNRWPTWSPDGSRIAFVHDGALHTMAPDGTDMREVAGVHPDGAIAWNPVG